MIEVLGQCAVEGFVRADVVVLGTEAGEGAVLGSQVGVGWASGLAFQHLVHVLVFAVLVGDRKSVV